MISLLGILLVITLATLILGALFKGASIFPRVADRPLAERIDAILPQTQCRQCGYSGCKPYAEALAAGTDQINRCPPGGEAGIRQLAALLNIDVIPFDPNAPQPKPKAVAVIDEQNCIGCTLCIKACPVDAILGAAKQMHTVIAAECTGCELCLPPCPVDCIDMQPIPVTAHRWIPIPLMVSRQTADQARRRYTFRQHRLERDQQEKAARLTARARVRMPPVAPTAVNDIQPMTSKTDAKRAAIEAAMARAAQRTAQRAEKNGPTQ